MVAISPRRRRLEGVLIALNVLGGIAVIVAFLSQPGGFKLLNVVLPALMVAVVTWFEIRLLRVVFPPTRTGD